MKIVKNAGYAGHRWYAGMRKTRNIWIFPNAINAVVYTGFCLWGGVSGAWGWGTFFIGEIKNFAFVQTRKFSINVLKSMKNL